MARVAVLVAGMHRSGTSALTRSLVGLGCDAPKTLMPADDHNAKGYWESTEIAALNDDILHSAGSSWDSWEHFGTHWYRSPVVHGFRDRAQTALANEFGDSPLFVLKDPRICRLMPFWLAALEDFGATPHVILPLRNPLEVAASLHQRDAIEPPFGLLMWLRNVLDAETESRQRNRAFLRYEELLADWQGTATKIGRDLGVAWPRQSVVAALEVDADLAPALRHHVEADSRVLSSRSSRWVATTYDILMRWTDGQILDTDIEQLDAINATLTESAQIFAHSIAAGMRAGQTNRQLEIDLGHLNKALDEVNQVVAARDNHIESLNQAVRDRDQAVQDRDEIIARKDRQIASLDTAVSDRDVRIDMQNHAIADRDGRIGALNEEVRNRDGQITNLERTVTDRDRQIEARNREIEARDREIEARGRQIEALDRTVANKDDQVADRDVTIANRDVTIAERDNQLASLEQSLRDREAQIEALWQSTSWRITAPLRTTRLIAAKCVRLPFKLVALAAIYVTRLLWRLVPLGQSRRQRWRQRLLHRLPERLATRFVPPLMYTGRRYVASGHLDLPDLNRAAAKNQGPVPILFDSDYYLANNADVQIAGVDPLTHYLEHGAIEGRLPIDIDPKDVDPVVLDLHRFDPSKAQPSGFDAEFYRAIHADMASLDSAALAEHYKQHGKTEGRIATKADFLREVCGSPREIPIDFHAAQYVELYPDLHDYYADKPPLQALQHYMLFGRWDPRRYTLRTAAEPAVHKPSVDLDLPALASQSRPLCVLAHVYYADLWDELSAYIANLPDDMCDLYVNLVDTTFNQQLLAKVRNDFPQARIYISENAGRDIGGHFQVLRNVRMEDYRIFCLVHTKKSPHFVKKSEVPLWRSNLLKPLMGSPEVAAENIRLMLTDNEIGQLGAERCRYTEITDNASKYFELLRKLNINEREEDVEFLSGTMMFLRSEVLQRIYEGTRDIVFEPGDDLSVASHRDGQWAHAIERVFGAAVRDMHYRFEWR